MSRFPEVVLATMDRYGLLMVGCPFCGELHFHERRDTKPHADVRFAPCRQEDLPKKLRSRRAALKYHIVCRQHYPRDPKEPDKVIPFPGERAGKKTAVSNDTADPVTPRHEERST